MYELEKARDHAAEPFIPLAEEVRERFPHVIYELQSNAGPAYEVVFASALTAAQRVGLRIVADVTVNTENGCDQIVVRTATAEHREHLVESALFHGAIGVMGNMRHSISEAGTAAATATAEAATESALRQITDNELFREAFGEYYGGLRWGSDQERFVRQLFEQATELDLALLEDMTSSDMAHLAHDLEIPYERRRDWYHEPPAEIFAKAPELDYRQLADPDFAATAAGQVLAEAYRKLCGHKVAQNYQQYPRPITEQGQEVAKPAVPLAHFPIVEALIADEVSMTRPRAKYNFGATEVIDLILESDSLLARRALTAALTVRLPQEQRHVFDGPDEFEHQGGVIRRVIRAYRNAQDPTWREEHKQILFDIFDAYTGNGAVAVDVRAEHARSVAKGHTWNHKPSGVKSIIKAILTATITSRDAADFIARYLPEMQWQAAAGSDDQPLPAVREQHSTALDIKDPLVLAQPELILVALDALGQVEPGLRPAVYERFCHNAFQSPDIARQLRDIAEMRVQAAELRDTPEVLLAIRGIHQLSSSFSHEKADEKSTARAALEEAMAPANALSEAATEATNVLLLAYLSHMVETVPLSDRNLRPDRLFNALVDRVAFGSTSSMRVLPSEYTQLLTIAEHSSVPDRLKSHVLWGFAETFSHCDQEAAQLLLDVILDGYRVMLGETGALRLPTDDTNHGLAALNHLVHKNSISIFGYAREDQLMSLRTYQLQLLLTADRIKGSRRQDGLGPHDREAFKVWQANTLQYCQEALRETAQLEEFYKEYLHLEEVKVKPHIYYPWLMKHLGPLWQKMQWEVGPGNRPSGSMRGLHQMLRYHITDKLVLQEGGYPEDFDAFATGGLDTLLIECYDRMIAARELQDSQTVRLDGHTFMHYATGYMPSSVVEQFRAKYPNRKDFLKYLARNRRDDQQNE